MMLMTVMNLFFGNNNTYRTKRLILLILKNPKSRLSFMLVTLSEFLI